MDILIWILTCSLLRDDLLVQAIINTQSSGYQYYVGDSSRTTKGSFPDNLESSQKLLNGMLREGARPLVGLMGIPSELAAKYGRTPDELFDPCVNISVGTAILSELSTTCPRGPAFRYVLLKKYGSLLGYSDDYFVNAVITNISFIEMKKRRYRQMTGDSVDDHTKLLEQGKGLVDAAENWSSNGIFLNDRINTGSKQPLKTPGR